MTDIERLRALRDDLMGGQATVAAIDIVKRLDATLPNLLADYERLRGMEERVKSSPIGKVPIYEMGVWLERATVFFDMGSEVNADALSGQTVALVPVPGGE
jgi:hypothetical protein